MSAANKPHAQFQPTPNGTAALPAEQAPAQTLCSQTRKKQLPSSPIYQYSSSPRTEHGALLKTQHQPTTTDSGCVHTTPNIWETFIFLSVWGGSATRIRSKTEMLENSGRSEYSLKRRFPFTCRRQWHIRVVSDSASWGRSLCQNNSTEGHIFNVAFHYDCGTLLNVLIENIIHQDNIHPFTITFENITHLTKMYGIAIGPKPGAIWAIY